MFFHEVIIYSLYQHRLLFFKPFSISVSKSSSHKVRHQTKIVFNFYIIIKVFTATLTPRITLHNLNSYKHIPYRPTSPRHVCSKEAFRQTALSLFQPYQSMLPGQFSHTDREKSVGGSGVQRRGLQSFSLHRLQTNLGSVQIAQEKELKTLTINKQKSFCINTFSFNSNLEIFSRTVVTKPYYLKINKGRRHSERTFS